VIPEDEAPREGPRREAQQRDVLAARRARRAEAADPVPLRRAEAAEATAHVLEASLADLRRRLLETEHEHERAAQQLAEREHELRRVKQREYAEQQLRIEAEEHFTRLRRGHHAELDRLRQRVSEARAAARHAQEQREHAEGQRTVLAAHLDAVSESCARLQANVLALHGAAGELRAMFEHEREAARARIQELERALASAPSASAGSESERARREEMAGALAAAVERLRARVVAVEDLPEAEPRTPFMPRSEEPAAAPAETEMPPETETRASASSTPEAQALEELGERIPAGPVPVGPPLPGSAEAVIPTVVVVPRLFAAPRRPRPRLAALGRQLGTRLLQWADRTQAR
jgi:chromosome segregation ATPase